MDQKSSYRTIFKATSLFGGVQIINILIQIIRSKLIAVLLGTAGMGVAGLFTTTLGLIGSLTNFGLSISAVRYISEANSQGNAKEVSKVVSILRRLIFITGILGLITVLFFATWLSKITFGTEHYSVAFRWLSTTLLLDQLASGERTFLQGLRKIKALAKANVVGSIVGLFISIPLYYFYGIDGIVPALIASSFTAMVIAWFFSSKIKINTPGISWKDTFTNGKSMLKMGFMLSLSGLITMAVSYISRAYINHTGSLEEVGLYSAGFAIISSYVGLIFTAMGTDYFPRLSSVAYDTDKYTRLINQQAEIALLIIGPILCIFLIFAKWALLLLYSSDFIPITAMVQWAAIGMYFKAASWAIGFLFLAKGATMVFFWSELGANVYMLLFNISGYTLYGLDGLGISFLLSYVLVLIQVFIISKTKYNFSFSGEFLKIFGIQLVLALVCLTIVKITPTPYSYIAGSTIIAASFWNALKGLDKRLDIKTIIGKIKNRLK